MVSRLSIFEEMSSLTTEEDISKSFDDINKISKSNNPAEISSALEKCAAIALVEPKEWIACRGQIMTFSRRNELNEDVQREVYACYNTIVSMSDNSSLSQGASLAARNLEAKHPYLTEHKEDDDRSDLEIYYSDKNELDEIAKRHENKGDELDEKDINYRRRMMDFEMELE